MTRQLSSQEAERLFDKGGKIAWCAYRKCNRLNPDFWFDDAKAEAALHYWRYTELEGKDDTYAFTAAVHNTMKAFFTHTYNPSYVSYDAPGPDDNARPWIETLKHHNHDDGPTYSRLTNDDLRMMLCQVFTRPYRVNIEGHIKLIRYLQQGYSPFTIATLMDLTEEAVASMRARLKRALKNYCAKHDIPIPNYTTAGNSMQRYPYRTKGGSQ